MAAFQNVDPAVRGYFKRHCIPDIYEALLGGLLVMCPDDPLKFLEEKIKEIMEKGLHSVLWNTCIDPALGLRLKAISETYLHTLLGLDDDQLMTPELCEKAWYFYSTNLKRMCFDAWVKYCAMRKTAKEILQKKLSFARHYRERKILPLILKKWSEWAQFRKRQRMCAAKKMEKVFDCTLQKIVLKAWKKEIQFKKKTKKYIEHLEKAEIEEPEIVEEHHHVHHVEPHERRPSEKRHSTKHLLDDRSSVSITQRFGKDHLTRLPDRAVAQIFLHLNLVDLGRCAQVSRSWNAVTRIGSIWSNINFSAVKDKVRDSVAERILLKWHTNVVNLNLRGCATLQWLTFKSIGHCKNLQELNVSECQGLNDELMRLVSEGCPALLYLNLSHTDITNGTLRLLSRGFPNLQYLSLAYCRKFTDKGLHYLGSGRGCHKLIYLDISGCLQISVEGFRNIADSCSGIQHLIINEMPTLTDRCIQALAEKCLQIVTVEFNESPHVSDAAVKALSECKLVKMKIEGSNRITDLSFKLISKFWPAMKSIRVADCQKITDSALKLIAPLNAIATLNLSDCMRIGDTGIKAFAEGCSCSSIRELILANCSYITDASLVKIVQRCPNLVYLNLRYCQALTDCGIETLILLSSLACINISGIDITDQALETLGRHGRIKELTVSECTKISDTGIKRFCAETNKLDYLDVSYCLQLSNHSLKNLSFSCHKLTSLSVAGCPKVTDVGIQFLAAVCSYLHYLDISGCVYLTDKVLKYLGKGCMQLRILKMLYCTNITRQAVLKFSPRLQKYEYNDDEPPLWFGYDSSYTPPPKKNKKARSSVDATGEKNLKRSRVSIVESLAEKSSESIRPSVLSTISALRDMSLENRPSTLDLPAET
ncbi:F-box and leucine-rich repeat protein 13 [Tiliqua scincoides]|uniref:F-box and leucine-rich repeat protein 13 n=1 Tax=Tiliqua scincoides TaxID=71010 RepID=UPI0034631964